MKFRMATLVLVGGMLSPLASKVHAADPNPQVEAILAQIDARRAEKLAAEVTSAQERVKQMEERPQNGGMRNNRPGGGGGNRKPGGGNNQDQGK